MEFNAQENDTNDDDYMIGSESFMLCSCIPWTESNSPRKMSPPPRKIESQSPHDF